MGEASRAAFPATRWTLLRAAADATASRAPLDALAAAYWLPVYAHFRGKWRRSPEDAQDLTQEFFATLLDGDVLRRLAPEHGRFRSYVMAALDNFARNDHARASREKRGGDRLRVALDPGDEPSYDGDPEQIFLREWGRAVLSASLEELNTSCVPKAFELFLARDVDPPAGADTSYEALAARFGIAESDVTNFLYRTRKKFREIVLNRVRDTVTSEAEAEDEMMRIFGETGR